LSQDLPRNFGNYSLLKLLARGGMGEIYLARTSGITGFEKYYAVKKLLKKFTHDNDVGARFVDEAKLGARLQHPNIVQVYDLGRVQDELYMATEFVDGFDLRRVLRFCHEKKKRIPLDIALFIVREILSGLAYAHRQVDAEGHSINLIHRDISPQNVLVSFEGEVKIIDFGLAKSTQRSQETQANVLLGNFGYMSPEQARGHPLDVRTDVYSAGIVLFELVTGTKRFVEENPLRLLEMVARPTPIVPSDRVPQTPKAIDKIYAKATSPNRDDRYDSAESFRDEVTTALHKINPKASRENLAQFLNHLFLGGQAPAPVDADVLDKSVAIRVRDIHEASDAFQAPSESDLKDRRLHEFSDDAPQTASHPLMRQARAGDTLTHQQLTGEDISTPSAPTAHAMPAVNPPMPAASVATSGNAPELSEASEKVRPPQTTLAAAPVKSGDALTVADLAEVDENLVVDLGPEATPTSVYDTPSWPGELDRQAAEAQKQAQDEVQRQLDAQAKAAQEHEDVQAALQRQVEAQLNAAFESPATTPPPPAREAVTAPAPQLTTLPSPPKAPGGGRAVPLPNSPPKPQARVPQASTGTTTVVTTVGPPPKKPMPSGESQPSIVVAMDLDASEPTVVGANMPAPTRGAPVNSGFNEGGAHESLIIDFDGEGAPPADDPPPEKIRPAAKPVGKPVAATVATSKRRPADDAGPAGMPPPTRRR
jgi:serine/threonine protein kinase